MNGCVPVSLLVPSPQAGRLYGLVSAVQDALLDGVDSLQFSLLNDFQRGFPLVARPFASIGECLGEPESEVISELTYLRACGKVSRVGGVFAPRTVGASTLAALKAPPERLEAIAAMVSARTDVNHNYRREHVWNLWFVVTAATADQVEAALREIESASGCRVISLPLLDEFHIDLGFDLGSGNRVTHPPRRVEARAPLTLTAAERRLMTVLEEGLELVPRPYARIGMRSGMTEDDVLDTLARWLRDGVLKRFGVVVHHHELGFRANAMCVWNVPDDRAGELGMALAAEHAVTLCYRRARAGDEWPYNLYCMIHGRERAEVEAAVASINRRLRLGAYPHGVLFSLQRYKQTGARYAALPAG